MLNFLATDMDENRLTMVRALLMTCAILLWRNFKDLVRVKWIDLPERKRRKAWQAQRPGDRPAPGSRWSSWWPTVRNVPYRRPVSLERYQTRSRRGIGRARGPSSWTPRSRPRPTGGSSCSGCCSYYKRSKGRWSRWWATRPATRHRSSCPLPTLPRSWLEGWRRAASCLPPPEHMRPPSQTPPRLTPSTLIFLRHISRPRANIYFELFNTIYAVLDRLPFCQISSFFLIYISKFDKIS